MSCRELGQPDCDGWLLLRKVPGGFMSPRWRRCWFVLKKHKLYWYRQPQVRPYTHAEAAESPQGHSSCSYSPPSTPTVVTGGPQTLMSPSVPVSKMGTLFNEK